MNRNLHLVPKDDPKYDKIMNFRRGEDNYTWRRRCSEIEPKAEPKIDILKEVGELEIDIFLTAIEGFLFVDDDQPAAHCGPMDEQYQSVFVVTYH